VKWPPPVQIADNQGKPIKDVTESHQVLPQRLFFGVEENELKVKLQLLSPLRKL
jgi:hypothetical protein